MTEPPIELTPYQVKGAIIRQFPDHPIVPFINGAYRERYRYPRVQVKVLRKQLCIFGIGGGYLPVNSFQKELHNLEAEGILFEVHDKEIPQDGLELQEISDEYLRYKFITPWVALTQRALAHYKSLTPRERVAHLNRVLVQNLLFISRDLGYEPEFTVSVRVKLQTLSPRVVEEQGSGSFKGYFTSNMKLPDYLGLGNGITKGLGTIVRMPS